VTEVAVKMVNCVVRVPEIAQGPTKAGPTRCIVARKVAKIATMT